MPRASFSVCALLFLWVVLTAAQPISVTWNLDSSQTVLRVIRVVSPSDTESALLPPWPGSASVVTLSDSREAWIWEVPRDTILPPETPHEIREAQSVSDVICFDCSEQDRKDLEQVIGKPSTSDQDPDTLHPYSPITLVISNATAYPNPFNPLTDDATISVTLTEDADISITAYDWDGKYMATVLKGLWITGVNQTLWSGQTQDGRKLGNGVYFLRVVAKSGTRQEEQIIKVAVWNER